jgi:PadR family transcriptional regulator, regulatory protein PadR
VLKYSLKSQSNLALTIDTVYHTVYDVHYMPKGRELDSEIFENLKLELRRGCLTLAVLTQLREERYGYTLRKALAEDGLEIDEGTLYPLLRRLESQGLLVSQWREEDKRNKRFYRLSLQGKQMLAQLLNEWEHINRSLTKILQEA